ncbi:MAG: hypothetical protein MZV70_68160 [Desulfobacterales bacterium]|nr:hypothetical protein [Desulfobacterales bacterium]
MFQRLNDSGHDHHHGDPQRGVRRLCAADPAALRRPAAGGPHRGRGRIAHGVIARVRNPGWRGVLNPPYHFGSEDTKMQGSGFRKEPVAGARSPPARFVRAEDCENPGARRRRSMNP